MGPRLRNVAWDVARGAGEERGCGGRGAAGLCVGIACGGTGGHLFPAVAVSEVLRDRGVRVTLFVSPKEVDQRAVQGLRGVDVMVLPAAAWQAGTRLACLSGVVASWARVRRRLKGGDRWVVLGMGGFSSVPVVLAGWWSGFPVVLHEANAVAGRANRLLARWADRVLVGFEETARVWRGVRPVVTGMPVRREIVEVGGWDADRRLEERRRIWNELGLDPERPTVLVVGGSQGARGLNDRVVACAVEWHRATRTGPQWIHLAGPRDEHRVRESYRLAGVRAVVMGFTDRMGGFLAGATAVVARSGASFLAELAAVRIPAVLVPFPAAADDHQWHNARLYAGSGAARLVPQAEADPARLRAELEPLLQEGQVRTAMESALARWHRPGAAVRVAEVLLRAGRVEGVEARCRSASGRAEGSRALVRTNRAEG